MDEPNQAEPKTSNQLPTGRFMDIQAPSGTTEPAPSTAPLVAGQPDTSADEPASTDQTTEQHDELVISPEGQLSEVKVAEQSPAEPIVPVEEAPVDPDPEPAPSQPAVAETTPTESPADSAHEQTPATPEHPPLPPKTHGAPVVAIVLAIVITLGLSGLVIFTYLKSKNDTKLTDGTPTTAATSQQPIAKPQASPEDIDQVTSDIDESLSSIDETADFSSDDISDQALGL